MHGWQYQERYCPHVMTYTVLQNPAKFPPISVSKIIQFIHVIDMIKNKYKSIKILLMKKQQPIIVLSMSIQPLIP